MGGKKRKDMNGKYQTFKKTIATTKYAFSLVWNHKKGKPYIFLKGIMAIANALLPLVGVIMPGLIINELTGSRDLRLLSLYIGVLIVIPVISSLFNLIMNRFLYRLSLKLDLSFTEIMY